MPSNCRRWVRQLKRLHTQSVGVSALRKDRALHPTVFGIISPDLRGEISPGLWGNLTGLWGEISPDLRGEISPGLRGEISPDLRGDLTGLWGDLTGLTGNIDACELTVEEQVAGVNVSELVEETTPAPDESATSGTTQNP